MKSERLMRAIGGIEEKYILAAEPLQKDINLTSSNNKTLRVKKYIFTAASLLIIVSLSAIFIRNLSWFNNSHNNGTAYFPDTPSDTSESPLSTDNSFASDSTIRGLPVENFTLADIQGDSFALDRIGFMSFGSFFKYGIDNFAVIKVDEIHISEASKDNSYSGHQISDIRILQNLYGNATSDTIQITQSIIKDHFCLGTTNLLRKGGVYILPIICSDNTWYINGDMDVLFEVDDQGKVWSHSGFEEFSQFDGHATEDLINKIDAITSDEDFLLANSAFGNILENWTLADITVTEKSGPQSDEYGQYFNYAFNSNDILSYSIYQNDTDKSLPSDIITIYDNEQTDLQPGVRYLIFLDIYDGKISVNSRMIAEIKNDLNIEVIPASDSKSLLGESVFTPYNGYSLSEIKNMISRIDLWNSTHSDNP